jgi:Tfp pilus assembly protein PilF
MIPGRVPRSLIAVGLLVAAGTWTSTRVAAFQIRSQADAAFWSGNLQESLQGYQVLESFGPSGMKARAGQFQVYLSLLENPQHAWGGRKIPMDKVRSGAAAVLQRQLQQDAMHMDTWSGLGNLFEAVKPENQGHRIYSLEEISHASEGKLEIEDLLTIRALEVSLELDPNGVYQRDMLGDLAWQLDLKSLAKKYYGDVVTILPNPEKHPFLAPGAVDETLQEVVVEALRRAVQPPRNADPVATYRHLGMFLMDQGRYQEAFEAFQSAQDHSGLTYAGWKAQAKSSLGQWDEAIALYREAISSGQMPPEELFYMYTSLGDLLGRQGHHREAAQAFESALLLKPRDPGVLLRLGQAEEALGRWPDAEENYVRASEIGSDRITALAQLVAFYRRIGKPDMALVPAQKLVELQPDEPIYRKQLQELRADIAKRSD